MTVLSPPASNSNCTTHNTKSYILVPSLCKWVTSSLPPSLLSSLAGRRNEVVLSAVEECYFGRQVLQGLYWPRVSVDHSGLGHHKEAPLCCELQHIGTVFSGPPQHLVFSSAS